MLIKFFTKLFCSRKQITQFNPEIVQMGQDARHMAVQSCNANLGQIFEASFADQKPSRWRWQSNQQPEPPVVDPSTSTPSQPQGNVSFALPLPRPVRAASSTQQGRKHRIFLQARSHQQQVLSTLPRATRRPQARYPQTQEQLPKSHFSGPTTRNHTAHLLDQDPFDQSIGPDISISRRNPESFARRNYNPGQAASSMEIPLRKQGLLLQFANVGEFHNEQPDLLFKVDEPMTRRSEAKAIYQTKRTIQTTISLLLEQLKLQSQCKSFLVCQNLFQELLQLRLVNHRSHWTSLSYYPDCVLPPHCSKSVNG